MILYDYECAACQSRFEVKKSIKDDSPERCAICGATMQRLITRTHFDMYYPGIANGRRDGWYDYVFPKMQSVRLGDKKFSGFGDGRLGQGTDAAVETK